MKRQCWIGLLSLLASAHVSAYTQTSDLQAGLYWTSLPISMAVVSGNASDGNTLYQIANSESQKWEDATGQSIWDMGSGYVGSAGGSLIRWSTNFAAETGYDPTSTLAVTIRYQQGPYWAKTEIILNGNKASLVQSPATIKKVILHELGHTFGLDHSADSGSIMYAYLSSASTLSDDDIDGAIEAITINKTRSATGFVAAQFAGQGTSTSSNSLIPSCGTVGPQTTSMGSFWNTLGSLLSGLIPFVRKRRQK